MNDLENVIVAQRREDRIRDNPGSAYRVTIVSSRTDILVCHVDEGAFAEIAEELGRSSPTSVRAVDVEGVGFCRLNDGSAKKVRQVCRVETRRRYAGHGRRYVWRRLRNI